MREPPFWIAKPVGELPHRPNESCQLGGEPLTEKRAIDSRALLVRRTAQARRGEHAGGFAPLSQSITGNPGFRQIRASLISAHHRVRHPSRLATWLATIAK